MASPTRADAAPAPQDAGRVWLRRWAQSNLIVAVGCAYVFFILFKDLLSLEAREVAAAIVLAGWQAAFLLCILSRRRLPWLWPAARTTAAVVFVGWQLFFLLVRNPLDFWYTPIRDWCVKEGIWDHGAGRLIDPVNDATSRYANFNGIDQNWKMFTPPLSRSAQFLAVRIEFSDGSDELILSDEEPDPHGFFRFGGWRQRKLEYQLVFGDPADLPLCEAYARWSLRRWQAGHADDPRTPSRVVLLRRDVDFPKPGADPAVFPPAEVYTIGAFLPDGRPEP
ncbi:MAG TPA: hypothetical protein VMS17_28125 [Gemmataceae bacterium]|nr:hypothetical protein [Gemmataceae bacterium]